MQPIKPHMQPELLRRVLADDYGIVSGGELAKLAQGTSSEVWSVQTGTDHPKYVVKVVNNEGRPVTLLDELTWRERLRGTGYPCVPTLRRTLKGSLVAEFSSGTQGGTLSVEHYVHSSPSFAFLESVPSLPLLSAAGIALCRFHDAAMSVGVGDGSCRDTFLSMLESEYDSSALPREFTRALREERVRVSEWHSLPRVVVHGDFHPGNVAWSAGNISCVFDFEYVREDLRLFELAYSILFFCADWSSPLVELTNERSACFLNAYEAGFSSCSPLPALTQKENELLPRALRLMLLMNYLWADAQPEVSDFCDRLKIGSLSTLRLSEWLSE